MFSYARILLVFVAIIMSTTVIVYGQSLISVAQPSSAFRAIRPGALFLNIPADSRSSGMGGTGLATNPDVTAVFYNNAKLPFANESFAFHTSYTPWFAATGAEGMFLLAAGAYYKHKVHAFSAALKYFRYSSTSDFERSTVSATGYEKLTYIPYEFAVDLGYALRVSRGLSLGIAGRYVKSNLSVASALGENTNYTNAQAFLGDITLFYEKNINFKSYNTRFKEKNYYDFGYNKLYIGAAITNVGTRFNYSNSTDGSEMPPTQFKLGIGYRKIINELNKFTTTLELGKSLVPSIVDKTSIEEQRQANIFKNWMSSFQGSEFVNSLSINTGFEYWYNDMFAVRLGYLKSFKVNGNTGFTGGMSVRFGFMSFDVSYYSPLSNATNQNFDPLSNSVRVGATFYFR